MVFEPGRDVKVKTWYADITWEGIGKAADSVKEAAKAFIGHAKKVTADISQEIKQVGNAIAQEGKKVADVLGAAAKDVRDSVREGNYSEALSVGASIPQRLQDAVNVDNPLGAKFNESIERVKGSLEQSTNDMRGLINKAGQAIEQVRQVVTPADRMTSMTSMTSAKPNLDSSFSANVAAQTGMKKDNSPIFKPAISQPGYHLSNTPDIPAIAEECKKSDIKMRVLLEGGHFIDFESEEVALRFLEKLALQGKDFLVVSFNGDGSTVNIYDSNQGNFNVTRNVPAKKANDIIAFHPGLRSPVDLVNIRQEHFKEEVNQDLIENYVNFINQRRRHQDDNSMPDLDSNEIFDEVTRLREKCELKFESQEEAQEFFADQADEELPFMFYSQNEAGKCDYQVSVGDGKLYSGSVEDVMSQLQSQDKNNPEVSKALHTLNYLKQNPPKVQAVAGENQPSNQDDVGIRHRH